VTTRDIRLSQAAGNGSGVGTSTLARLVFWEPCVSPHMSAFIGAVARALGPAVDVLCVAHEDVPQDRQALGWHSGQPAFPRDGDPAAGEDKPSPGDPYRTIIAPSPQEVKQLVEESGSHCLHVFSGIRWFSTIVHALAEVRRTNRPFAIKSEPRDNEGLKGAARFVQSRVTEGWLRRNALFVLAIGRHGPPWFRSVGYAAERVFPFAYFLPSAWTISGSKGRKGTAGGTTDGGSPGVGDAIGLAPMRDASRKLEIVFIGRFIEQKGLRYLLPAIAANAGRMRLTLIGGGPLRDSLGVQARAFNLDVTFSGVLPIDEVQRKIGDFDVLALPSLTKDDGWGAVVSEALLAGTAVIASSCAGASILLDEPGNGRVVPPGDTGAIARAILDLESSGALTPDAREARSRWASTRLTAQAGAEYFMKIVGHRLDGGPRPTEFYQ